MSSSLWAGTNTVHRRAGAVPWAGSADAGHSSGALSGSTARELTPTSPILRMLGCRSCNGWSGASTRIAAAVSSDAIPRKAATAAAAPARVSQTRHCGSSTSSVAREDVSSRSLTTIQTEMAREESESSAITNVLHPSLAARCRQVSRVDAAIRDPPLSASSSPRP
jgi:hypothetical protein